MDLEGVHERLKERGATDDLCSYVEDLLMNQHQRYHNFMTAEADKRRLLLEYLHNIEVCMLALNSVSGMPDFVATQQVIFFFVLMRCRME